MIYIENKKYKYFRASYLIIFNESDKCKKLHITTCLIIHTVI